VLGLRYFVCGRCDTTVAAPAVEPPDECASCGAIALKEISDRLRDPSYFLAVE
jgi:rRNA maturation endonuclease Nob1